MNFNIIYKPKCINSKAFEYTLYTVPSFHVKVPRPCIRQFSVSPS